MTSAISRRQDDQGHQAPGGQVLRNLTWRSTRACRAQKNGKTSTSSSSADFFDLIVVHECHRGSAANDSAWREILDYFKEATHLGIINHAPQTKVISNIDYFGEPIYSYSLKQGIEDGLAIRN